MFNCRRQRQFRRTRAVLLAQSMIVSLGAVTLFIYSQLESEHDNELSFDCVGEFASFVNKSLGKNAWRDTSRAQRLDSTGTCWKILLIVVFNQPYYKHIPFIRRLYEPVFHRHIIFIGALSSGSTHPDVLLYNFGSGKWKTMGEFQHVAIAQAIAEHPDYDGYVFAGDDVFINTSNLLSTLDPGKIGTIPISFKESIWRKHDTDLSSTWYHWSSIFGLRQVRKALPCLPVIAYRRMHEAFGCDMCFVSHAADFGYIPRRYAKDFIHWMIHLRHTANEIAVASALRLIAESNKDVQEFSGRYTWEKERARTVELFKENHVYLHPVKFSNTTMRVLAEEWLKLSVAQPNALSICL